MNMQNYMKQPIPQGGRNKTLYAATRDALRQGKTADWCQEHLLRKAVDIDGLDERRAASTIQDAIKAHLKHPEHSLQAKSPVLSQGLDVQTLDIELSREPMPNLEMSPSEQMIAYLNAVFESGAVIDMILEPRWDQQTKRYVPVEDSSADHSQGQKRPMGNARGDRDRLITMLSDPNTTEVVVRKIMTGTRGGYIRVNPVNNLPGTKSDDDVTNYRHVLIESDHMDLELQVSAIRALQLPVSAMVYSGNKSIHFLVRVDAGRDYRLYEKRVAFIHKILDMGRIKHDTSVKNPSRLSRIPGMKRVEGSDINSIQRLLGLNMGFGSYQEWEAYALSLIHNIPKPMCASDTAAHPERQEPVIQGVLDQEGIMILAAPKKAGKSLLVMDLGLQIATGGKWLDFECNQHNVLLVNLEIMEPVALERIRYIAQRHQMSLPDNLHILSLDNSDATMETMAKVVVAEGQRLNADVVIVDPVYTLMGDETSMTEAKKLQQTLCQIRSQLGATVIFCHHTTKAAPGSFNRATHADKISGSGVLTRFPDAIVTLVKRQDDTATMRFTLRSHEDPEDRHLKFDYPVYTVSEETSQQSAASTVKVTREAAAGFMKDHADAGAKDLMNKFGISQSLAYQKLKEYRASLKPQEPDESDTNSEVKVPHDTGPDESELDPLMGI